MDYKEKYEKGLELAKSYYDKGTNEFLDTIFPELKARNDKTYEVCPQCGEEVELDAELKIQTCPSCGARIVTCSMCRAIEVNDKCCINCPLEIQARLESREKAMELEGLPQEAVIFVGNTATPIK